MNSVKNGTYIVEPTKTYNRPKFEGSISKFEVRNAKTEKIANWVIMCIFNEVQS